MENKKTVLITGFGPFGEHKINPSWEAVKLLPQLFKSYENSNIEINLLVEEIPVSYKDVDEKIKILWERYKPCIIIHVGVSSIAKCLTIESQAHNYGYEKPDIHGKHLAGNIIDPKTFKPKCDINQIVNKINENLKDDNIEACISDNAGRYLCEYIFYKSLSINEPKVLFIHVPKTEIYTIFQTAQGLLQIVIHMIESCCV